MHFILCNVLFIGKHWLQVWKVSMSWKRVGIGHCKILLTLKWYPEFKKSILGKFLSFWMFFIEQKVSLIGVFLVHIFLHLDWFTDAIKYGQNRDQKNSDTFFAVFWKRRFELEWLFESVPSVLITLSKWETRNNKACTYKISCCKEMNTWTCYRIKWWRKKVKHKTVAEHVIPWNRKRPYWKDSSDNEYFHDDPQLFYRQHYFENVSDIAGNIKEWFD